MESARGKRGRCVYFPSCFVNADVDLPEASAYGLTCRYQPLPACSRVITVPLPNGRPEWRVFDAHEYRNPDLSSSSYWEFFIIKIFDQKSSLALYVLHFYLAYGKMIMNHKLELNQPVQPTPLP